jgi:hypothetical protein
VTQEGGAAAAAEAAAAGWKVLCILYICPHTYKFVLIHKFLLLCICRIEGAYVPQNAGAYV